MPSFHTAVVAEILAERTGLQRVTVTRSGGDPERAYVLTGLTGPARVGDRVVVNTTAVELGLGTGGWHVVHWNLAHDDLVLPGGGHIMKLRYTSLQADTGGAEEHLGDLPADLGGMPVVVCTLHSQMAVVAAAVAEARPGTRVAYVMTDGAALPIAISDLVADVVDRGLIAHTVTAGHAFGGDLEAVTVASALTMARHHLAADLAVVAMGPGVVGTGTRLGTTAIEAAAVVDVAGALGGRPLLCLRLSDGDGRPRHQGISHHTRSVIELCHRQAVLPWPEHLPPIDPSIDTPIALDGSGGHQLVTVAVPDGVELLARHHLRITTMGRGPDQDPAFFAAAAAAGVAAADRVEARGDGGAGAPPGAPPGGPAR